MATRQLNGSGVVCLLGLVMVLAAGTTAVSSDGMRTYIVQMSELAKPSAYTTHRLWYYSTFSAVRGGGSMQVAANGSDGDGHPVGVLHTYNTVFHGFAARLTIGEAKRLEAEPGVLTVHPEGVRQLQTTHTPDFLGLDSSSGLLAEAGSGEDVIIGVLDTGVWPERKSFDDDGLGAIPSKWKGSCVQEASFDASACNKKLIGAKYYVSGYEAEAGPVNTSLEFRSPRDGEGHGTHTASTAGGAAVRHASTLGLAPGTARGMAPKARLAVYKICWLSGCYDSDILAAFDDAVADGVDVISLSVGGDPFPYYEDSIAIGAYGATKKGVLVSCSAGNRGPSNASVANVAPWMITVAASTVDRKFPAYVSLGNGENFEGTSLYSGKGLGTEPLPVVYAGNASRTGEIFESLLAAYCPAGYLDPAKVAGKIVLCIGGNSVAKGEEVLAAGGVGVILQNTEERGDGLSANAHVLPAALVGFEAGNVIAEYAIRSDARGLITFGGTVLGAKPAPMIAAFSSRGPNSVTPEILKPDITAPGVNILAAWTDAAGPSGLEDDDRRVEFNIISGTSMSCPHISGIAALLRAAHPKWTPAAIKSAMMTTSYVYDNTGGLIREANTSNVTTAFSYGAGHVDPQKALDPGLVYDLEPSDYVNFFCSLDYPASAIRQLDPSITSCSEKSKRGSPSNLNYPSYSALFNQSSDSDVYAVTFKRTLSNVGFSEATYTASWVTPAGAKIEVKPDVLNFTKGHRKRSFKMHMVTEASETLEPAFGLLIWTNGRHVVQSPIVVNWVQPDIFF